MRNGIRTKTNNQSRAKANDKMNDHTQHWTAYVQAREDFIAALEAALKPGVNEPSWRDEKLAEMVMSDCGYSTNDTRLLERITNRIAAHMSAPPAQPPCKWPACQTEEHQHRLANDVANELIGAPPRLTDEQIGMLTVFDGLHHVEVPLLAKYARAAHPAAQVRVCQRAQVHHHFNRGVHRYDRQEST